MEFNLMPFLCDAITLRRENFKKIDELYNKNKYEYYNLAVNSNLYNSSLISDSDFLKEEYSKKFLGILLFLSNNDNTELFSEIELMIKQSYSYAYVYYTQNNKINLENFIKAFMRKQRGKVTDDELNSNLVILYILSTQNESKQVIMNEYLKIFEEMLVARTEHSKFDTSTRISIDNLDKTILKKLNKRKSEIGICDRNTMLKKYFDSPYDKMLSFLFDDENITTSMFDYIEMTDKNILEHLYLINFLKSTTNTEEFSEKYDVNNMIILLYMRYMLKAYKAIKELYFKNNKETMYMDMENIQKQLNKTKDVIKVKDMNILELNKQLQKKENTIKKLSNEILNNKLSKEELISLRNSFFNTSLEFQEIKEENIDYDVFETNIFLILGGHDTLQIKLKEILKNSIFINTDNLNFDVNLIQKAEIIIIFPNYLNHAIYYKVIDKARTLNKKILHITNTNISLILNQIYTTFVS